MIAYAIVSITGHDKTYEMIKFKKMLILKKRIGITKNY